MTMPQYTDVDIQDGDKVFRLRYYHDDYVALILLDEKDELIQPINCHGRCWEPGYLVNNQFNFRYSPSIPISEEGKNKVNEMIKRLQQIRLFF
jgi:hypothetical protein